jgi:hypothetical protein
VKATFDWWIPIVVTAVICSLGIFRVNGIPMLQDKGVVSQVNGLVQVLVGFYIAALAAVATYGSSALDQQFDGQPITLKRKATGTRNLTRRQFLSLLFSYLAFLCFVIYIVGMLSTLFAGSFQRFFNDTTWVWTRRLAIAIYCFVCVQMVVITMLSLFYLGDRMHRSRASIVPRREQQRDREGPEKPEKPQHD